MSTVLFAERGENMKQLKTNMILRLGIAKLGLRNWQAAEIIGLSESYFSRIIRKEMPYKKQIEMFEKIREGAKYYDENN